MIDQEQIWVNENQEMLLEIAKDNSSKSNATGLIMKQRFLHNIMIYQEIPRRILLDDSTLSELPNEGRLMISSLSEIKCFNDEFPSYTVPGTIPLFGKAQPGIPQAPVNTTVSLSPFQAPSCLRKYTSGSSSIDLMPRVYHKSIAAQPEKEIGNFQNEQGNDPLCQRREYNTVSYKKDQATSSLISVFNCTASSPSSASNFPWYESQRLPIILGRNCSVCGSSIFLSSALAKLDKDDRPRSPLPSNSPRFEIDLSGEANDKPKNMIMEWKPTRPISQSSDYLCEAGQEMDNVGSACEIFPLKLFYSMFVGWWSGRKRALSQTARSPAPLENSLVEEYTRGEKATDKVPNSGVEAKCYHIELERLPFEDPFVSDKLASDVKADKLIIADDDKCYSSPAISAFVYGDPTPPVDFPRSGLKKKGAVILANCPSKHVHFILEESSAPPSPNGSFDAYKWKKPSNGEFLSRLTTKHLNNFHLDHSSSFDVEDYEDDKFEPISLMESTNVALLH
ncbi:hypothetical protein O6H91_03G022500 [Diphasiastrum complanatum]|uniref:Uncharacterized protein n=1 Tax=Diphasiastrum complanatum TaxID=34168 RepID=A0ACC2E4F5_DIPCM|nr:hypothetical protein O6H91_03G022500 [Diphasiastrum complanatum]